MIGSYYEEPIPGLNSRIRHLLSHEILFLGAKKARIRKQEDLELPIRIDLVMSAVDQRYVRSILQYIGSSSQVFFTSQSDKITPVNEFPGEACWS